MIRIIIVEIHLQDLTFHVKKKKKKKQTEYNKTNSKSKKKPQNNHWDIGA